jgi:hypothetical protein
MRSTIKAGGATIGITAGPAGIVMLGIAGATGVVEAVALSPHEAALLAGEIERGAWIAQRASVPTAILADHDDGEGAACAHPECDIAHCERVAVGHLGMDL